MLITRRQTLPLFGAVATSTFLQGAPASAATTVRLSYQRSSTLLTLLRAKGTLEPQLAARGYSVSWHLFDDILQAMNAGVVDMHGDVADAVPIFTQSAGTPLTFYAKEIGSPAAEAIIVRADSPIHSVADLKGKTVAVGRGSGCHFILAAALKQVGLSFRDITPAYLRPVDGAIAFERGSVDAWVIWDPFLAITEAKVATRTLADASGLSRYDRYYMVNDRFVEAHPDAVGILFNALVDMGVWVKQHPQETAEQLAPLWGGIPKAVIETVNNRRSYKIRPADSDGFGDQQAIADTFAEAGLIPKRIDTATAKVWHPEGSRT